LLAIGTKSVHEAQEVDKCVRQRENHSRGDDQSEFLEKDNVATEQEDSAA